MADSFNAVGRRKTAVARVYLRPGSGNVTINKKSADEYLNLQWRRDAIEVPFKVTETEGKFDVVINAKGGGIKGQIDAIRLGISRCLAQYDEELTSALRAEGLLTRDARMVERKKYGRPKARKRFQFSKR